MSTPAKPTKSASSDEASLPVVPSFEERLRLFWEKNGTKVLIVCALVLIAIVAKGGWELMEARKQVAVSEDYAAAGNTPEKLTAFASANSGALSGIALIRVADLAYTAGKFADAVTAYEKAASVQSDAFLTARAKLGLAMAKIGAGRAGEGETSLIQIVGDATIDKSFRAEAAYQLASLSFGAGKTADVKKYADQITQIDPQSAWAQRALYFQAATISATAEPAKAADSAAPAIQLNVPGK